jgi:hypothetical protein
VRWKEKFGEEGLRAMKVLRTTTCVRQGHPEFRIAYDPAVAVVADDADWLLGWLEESVAAGTRYKVGQTCQVGWLVTEVRQHESGDLALWEPDMRSLPVEWAEGVSHTLAHLRLHKDVVESVLDTENLSFPSMRQSAIICTRPGQQVGVVMDRTEPVGMDSGWFCGCREDGHDHNDVAQLRRVSLYEAAARNAPQILPYMALPPGVMVSVSESVPVVFRDGEPLDFRPGSYLAVRYAGR